MVNILICDDEPDILRALQLYLTQPDVTVFEAKNGIEAVEIAKRETLHLILLDLMMPGMDGMTAMAKIREFSNVPVILLTAKSEDADKILGLTLGADDYITKPFSPMELKARVQSQLRRYLQLGSGTTQSAYCIGGIALDDKTKQVTLDGEPVSLTPKEFEILRFLMANPGQVFSPKALYEAVWHEKPLGSENTVAVHIRHLREKIELCPAEPRYLKLVFGQGYKMEGGKS